jgi:hypothetical protein
MGDKVAGEVVEAGAGAPIHRDAKNAQGIFIEKRFFHLFLWKKIFIFGKKPRKMEITVLDFSFDFAEFENDSKLLWSVVPFAKGINVASFLSNLVLYDLDKDKISERDKVDFIKITLGKPNVGLNIVGLEKGFQEYLKIKGIKHKDKNALILVKRVRNSIESLFNKALIYVQEVEKVYKLDELHSFFSNPHKGLIGLYFLEAHEPTEFCAFEVETVTTTILNGHEIPLFTDEVEKYIGDPPNPPNETEDLRQADAQNACDGEKKIYIIREKFLEFVSPRTFSKNKLEIVRGELTNFYEPLGNLLKSFKSDLLYKKEYMGIAEVEFLYEDSIKPAAKKLQEAIDENIYFQQIENSSVEKERFTLYFCVCSVEDLLMFTEKATKMPRATIDFSREEIKGKTDLERLTIFLYLKVNEDGNNDF